MITSSEDYLKFLHQIQNNNIQTKAILLPTDETIYEINLQNRQVQAPEFLSVLKDHRSETIYFKIDRYFDNMDLANTVCMIQYVNEGAENVNNQSLGHAYVPPFLDIEHFKDDNKILIPWMIEGPATAAAGKVVFAIKFYLLDEYGENFIYQLNTLPAESKVLYGMDIITDNENFIIPDSEVYNIYQRINEIAQRAQLTWIILDEEE